MPLPRLRLNVPIGWSNEHHSVAVIGHFVSAYRDDTVTNPPAAEIDESDPQYELAKVDAMFTLDASYGYTMKDVIGASTEIRVGVINLLDQDPPFVDILGGFDVYTADPRGRTFYARLTQEF
jgi:iron complex outermembrane receptor protein